jgi:hypothetical protein
MLRTFLIILLASLSSCGFQVIYKENKKPSELSLTSEMAAVKIKKDRVRLNQELKNNLYDLLNPDYVKAEPKYVLTLGVKESISSTFTTTTGSSGRNKMTIDVIYQLHSLKNGDLISSGTTSVNDSYDVTTNRYGTYVAEDYVKSNLTKIAAQNIRNSLVNDFIEARKKCDGGSDVEKDENFVCPF